MRSTDATRITYHYERWRAVSTGIMETAQSTFLLLIAVRYFDAPPMAKALVVAGGSLGLLSTPVTVWAASRLRLPVAIAAARILFFGAGCFILAAILQNITAYIICVVSGMTAMMSTVPLLTHMYQENYPDRERGSKYSKTAVIRILSVAAFGAAAGWLLDGRIDRYPIVLIGFSLALLFSGYCLSRCPTSPVAPESGSQIFRGFRYLGSDPVFRRTLISWMFMGIGNLMMLPLRVEFLANPRYGFAFPEATIAVILTVIPTVTRVGSIVVWGRLFDNMNFFVMRAILNVGFGAGIALFFIGGSTEWFYAAAVLFGLSMAGGDIAWSLWVTKIAPPKHVADYMSVHTFLTGTRHAAAPFLAFSLVQVIPIQALAAISAGLILTASALLVPLFTYDIRKGRGTPVAPVEDQD